MVVNDGDPIHLPKTSNASRAEKQEACQNLLSDVCPVS